MDEAYYPETLVIYQTSLCLIQEDSVHNHSRENLKRHIVVYCKAMNKAERQGSHSWQGLDIFF
jgi:hypothetical protein